MHPRTLALLLGLSACGARTTLHDPDPASADGAVASPCARFEADCAYPARCQGDRCVLPPGSACAP